MQSKPHKCRRPPEPGQCGAHVGCAAAFVTQRLPRVLELLKGDRVASACGFTGICTGALVRVQLQGQRLVCLSNLSGVGIARHPEYLIRVRPARS